MSIGYACLALAVPGSDLKTCTLKNANEIKLLDLIRHNLDSLDRMIDYNSKNDIKLYRVSSDIIPFGSSVASDLPWQQSFANKLSAIGDKIKRSGMRVSMHPGQYTVLNSPDPSVAARAVKDLNYHAIFLDSLGLGPEHKLILHMGGVYGDKKQAKSRFIENYKGLSPSVKKRLVLENDGALFHICDILEVARVARIPVVYDNLHNTTNPPEQSKADRDWILEASATWSRNDGLQKIHYSEQHHEKRLGAHSETISIDPFLEFYNRIKDIELDIMLEVKDKNISAVKCINCVSHRDFTRLEEDWAHYKYSVLEHSQEIYREIRQLLRNKAAYPALELYHLIEQALEKPIEIGNAINAAQHVWGYFKEVTTDTEKKRFQRILNQYNSGEGSLQSVKNNLMLLAKKYQEEYLLNSYYFYI